MKGHWYNKRPNFGDAICPALVEFACGRKIAWGPPEEADLFGVGSIVGLAADEAARRRANGIDRPVLVWGSGLMTPRYLPAPQREGMRILALRGPITAASLEVDNVPMGDPALLVRRMYPGLANATRKYRGGVVLHHLQRMPPEAERRLGEQGWTYINAGSDDYESVIRRIAECEVILSSSLHGLVAADALGIPNEWVDAGRMHPTQRFKFYDYATAIGRWFAPPPPLGSLDLGLAAGALAGRQPSYWKRIDTVIERLIASLARAEL
ncbi:MAG: polysaccharide pyruvyl transferase family protein [Burkholderiales bacterium]|nr:polysaccharide pyruvyl transferase family protein [Burkholderiales bacterium]